MSHSLSGSERAALLPRHHAVACRTRHCPNGQETQPLVYSSAKNVVLGLQSPLWARSPIVVGLVGFAGGHQEVWRPTPRESGMRRRQVICTKFEIQPLAAREWRSIRERSPSIQHASYWSRRVLRVSSPGGILQCSGLFRSIGKFPNPSCLEIATSNNLSLAP